MRTVRAALATLVVLSSMLIGTTEAMASNVAPVSISFLSATGQNLSTLRLHAQSPDLVIVKVTNNSSNPSSSQVDPTLSFSDSSGITVSAVELSGATISKSARSMWPCSKGSTVVCQLRTPSGGPYVIQPNTSVLAAVIFSSGAITPGTPGLSVSATGALSGVGSGNVRETVVMGQPTDPVGASGLRLLVAGDSIVTAGQSASLTYTLDDGGRSAIRPARRGAASVTLSKLLPGSIIRWRATGTDWKCTGKQNASPTCTTSSTVATGSHSAPLQLSYVEAPGLASTQQHPIAPKYLLWQVGVLTHMATSRTIVGKVRESVALKPRVADQLEIAARVTGSSLLTPGASTTMEVDHRALAGTVGAVKDRITLPSGVSVARAVSSNGWRCPAGAKVITCTHAASLRTSVSGNRYSLTLSSKSSVQDGVAKVSVLSQDAVDGARSSSSVPLFFLSFGGPRLVVNRYPSTTNYAAISNGSLLGLTSGVAQSVVYRVTNAGDKPIAAKSVLHVSLGLTQAGQTLNASLASAHEAGLRLSVVHQQARCTAGALGSWSCAITLSKGLAAGALSAPFVFSVSVGTPLASALLLNLSPTVQAQIQAGQLFAATASLSGDSTHPPSVSQHLDVSAHSASDLEPLLSTSAQLVAGGSSVTATARIENFGSATQGASSVTYSIPPSLQASVAPNSSCTLMAHMLGGQMVTCSVSSIPAATPGQAGTRPTPAISGPMTFTLSDLSAVGQVVIPVSVADASTTHPITTAVTLAASSAPLVALHAPSDLAVTQSGTPGALELSFRTPSNAAPNQLYLATLCTNQAMTQSCVTRDVTVTKTVTGLLPATTYWVTVTALASPGYVAATSSIVSAAVSSAPIPVARRHDSSNSKYLSIPPALGSNFCDLVSQLTALAPPTTLAAPLGGDISVSLSGVTLSNSSCSASGTTISFTGGSLDLNGTYSLSLGAGTVTSSGFSIGQATLTTPAAWSGGPTVLTGSNITVTLAGASNNATSALSGTFSANTALGLPLGSGWSATTTIVVHDANSVTSGLGLSVAANDGSNAFAVSGTASLTGTYQVSVSGSMNLGGASLSSLSGTWTSGSAMTAQARLSVGGTTIAVNLSYTSTSTWSIRGSGSFSLFGTTSAAVSGMVSDTNGTVSGSLASSITAAVASGMTTTLTLSWTPSDTTTVVGTGSLTLGAQGSLATTLSYTSTSDYSFSVTGQTTLDQVTLTNISGSYQAGGSLNASAQVIIGGAPLSVSLSYQDPTDWSLQANGSLAMFANTQAAASGTIVDVAGTVSGTFSLSVTGGELAPSITADMSATWTPTTVVNGVQIATSGLTGTATITAGTAGSLSASFSYTSATNYQFAITSGSITVDTVSISNVSGSIANGGVLSISGTIAIGGASLSVTEAYTNDTTWTLSANSNLSLFGATASATGSISEGVPSGGGSAVVTGGLLLSVNASLPGSMTLTASMNWTPSAGLSGTGTLNLGFPGTLAATITYVDASDYALSVSGSLSLGAMTLNSVSGTYGIGSLAPSAPHGAPSYALVVSASVSIADTSLTIALDYANARTWQFDATSTYTIFGAALSGSGLIAENNGTVTGTLTFSLANAVTVAPGAVLSNTQLSWDITTASLIGSSQLAVGGVTLAMAVSYHNAHNWSLSVTAGSTGSLSLAPGFSLTAGAFTGTLGEASGVLAWSLQATASSVTLVNGADGMSASLGATTIALSSSCPTNLGNLPCPSGSNSLYLGFSTTLNVTLGNGLSPQTISAVGAYGVDSHSFVLGASLSTISIGSGLLSISGAQLVMAYGAGAATPSTSGVSFSDSNAGKVNGLAVFATGQVTLNVPGDSATVGVTFTYANGGFVVEATLPSGGTIGATGAQLQSLAYVSVPQTITLGSLVRSVTAPGLVFGGTIALPTWLDTYLGLAPGASASLFASYQSASVYAVSAVFNIGLPVDTGSSQFGFSFTSFTLTLGSNGSGPYQQVSATGTMAVSGSAGNQSAIAVTAMLSYIDATETIAGSISAVGQGGASIWDNAFGVTGLDITGFAISLSVELATTPLPLPGLGLAASFTLAGSSSELWSFLGVAPNTPMTAIVNLQASNPCMDISIGTAGSSTTAIDVFNAGVLKANYANLIVAPDGCQVGVYSVAPGIALDFQGSFLNTPVNFQTTVEVSPTLSIEGSLSIGAFSAGPVNFSATTVCIAAGIASSVQPCSDIQSGTQAVIGFSGGISVLGTTVDLSGAVSATAMTLSGTIANLDTGGFGISSLVFSGTYQSSPLSFALSETGNFEVFGTAIAESASFSYANGQIDAMAFSVAVPNIALDSAASLNGTISFYASSVTGEVDVAASGSISVGGFTLRINACPNGSPGLTITSNGATLCSATMYAWGVFTANVSGQLWWGTPPSGQLISNAATGATTTASAGDFSFSAENVTMGIQGFSVQGTAALSDIGGNFSAMLSLGLYLSNAASQPAIEVQGSFTQNGAFTLTGSGTVDLGGLGVNLNVTAASTYHDSGSVSASGSFAIAGTTINVAGSFSAASGGISASLSGTADFAPGGFNLGNVTTSVTVSPGYEDITLSASVNLGNVLTAGINTNIGIVNGQAAMYLTVDAGFNMPGINISGNLTLTNCSSSSCTSLTGFSASIGGQFTDFTGASYSFGSVAVNTNWSFSFNVSGWTNNCSGVVNTGANEWQACFGGSYSLTVSSSSPYLTFAVNFQASVNAANWEVNTSCSGSWYPSSWNCNTSSYFGGWYSVASVGVSVDSQGNLTTSFAGVNMSIQI